MHDRNDDLLWCKFAIEVEIGQAALWGTETPWVARIGSESHGPAWLTPGDLINLTFALWPRGLSHPTLTTTSHVLAHDTIPPPPPGTISPIPGWCNRAFSSPNSPSHTASTRPRPHASLPPHTHHHPTRPPLTTPPSPPPHAARSPPSPTPSTPHSPPPTPPPTPPPS